MNYVPMNYVLPRNSLPLLESRAEFWERKCRDAEDAERNAPRIGVLFRNR